MIIFLLKNLYGNIMEYLQYKIKNDKKLSLATNDIPLFSLNGKIKKCKIVDVYDGDTCKAVFYLNKELHKWNIRMIGYDTPELRPRKNVPNREHEILKAKQARDFLKSLVMNPNQLVYIKCHEFDKYGRLLGEILIDKDDMITVNQLMIDKGHGVPYDGGTKLKII